MIEWILYEGSMPNVFDLIANVSETFSISRFKLDVGLLYRDRVAMIYVEPLACL